MKLLDGILPKNPSSYIFTLSWNAITLLKQCNNSEIY